MLAKEPDDVFLNFSLAMELAKEGMIDDAMSRFDRVLTLDPKYTAAYFQRATTLIAGGRTAEAKRALQEGISAAQRVGDPHAAAEMQGVLDRLA